MWPPVARSATWRASVVLPHCRGDLLAKLAGVDAPCAEFQRAAPLTRNARERKLLLERARVCAGGSTLPESR